ncbi:MAG: anti-sigma factor [Vicinamibacterales bacterium]
MRPDERTVAGLTCSQVLEVLSAYADGEVPAALAARIDAHVAECRACERFGQGFTAMLAGMRRHLGPPDPVPDEVAARLRAALTD